MEPRIETLNEKKFIGKRVIMSFSEDRTRELWQGFMPRRKEIKNCIALIYIVYKSMGTISILKSLI